jgi:hypothetical protein
MSAQGSAPKLKSTRLLPTSRLAAAWDRRGATPDAKNSEKEAADWALALVTAKSMISIRSLWGYDAVKV